MGLSDRQGVPFLQQENMSNISSELANLAKVTPPVSLKKVTIMVFRPVCPDCERFIKRVNKNKELDFEVEYFHIARSQNVIYAIECI